MSFRFLNMRGVGEEYESDSFTVTVDVGKGTRLVYTDVVYKNVGGLFWRLILPDLDDENMFLTDDGVMSVNWSKSDEFTQRWNFMSYKDLDEAGFLADWVIYE